MNPKDYINDPKFMAEMRKIVHDLGTYGTADPKFNVLIAGEMQANTILDSSSGFPRINNYNQKKFNLVTSQPLELELFNPSQIRCCLCNKIIRYPAWYRINRYDVNHFHYLICFDPKSPSKVTTTCMREKGIIP